MLSLVVVARDEADRIGRCLRSVPFAQDRVVIVDQRTVDDTARQARREGARVSVEPWRGFCAQKNRALTLARAPWVLSLDADEWLTPAAAAEVKHVVSAPHPCTGFRFPRCSHWLGRPMRHGHWYPDRQLRLVRAGAAVWEGGLHERLVVAGAVGDLTGDIGHAPYRSIWEHLDTIDRYSALHADALRATGRRGFVGWGGMRGALHFVDAMLRKAAWRDGVDGIAVATLGAAHTALKWRRARRRR